MNSLNIAKFQRGAVVLLTVLILLAATSTIVLYSINSSIVNQRIIANVYISQQAFEASEAGLQYGIAYLQQNSDSILVDSDHDGKIDPFTTNNALPDGSKYIVSYTNPIDSDYTLIQVTSTGISKNSLTQHQVQQLMKFESTASYLPPLPNTTKGKVELSGFATITNKDSHLTVWSGKKIKFKAFGKTISNDGLGSSKFYTHTDIQPDDSNLNSITNDDFFLNFFGMPQEDLAQNVSLYYENDKTTNYNNLLDNVKGKSIWIEQKKGVAMINSTTQIGTEDNPVVLIVNGKLKISDWAKIYGIIYVTQDWWNNLKDHAKIYGGVIADGNFKMSGFAQITYNQNVINKISQQVGVFSPVPGSWKDF